MNRLSRQQLVAILLVAALTLASVIPVAETCASSSSSKCRAQAPDCCCCRKAAQRTGCCGRSSEARRPCRCNVAPGGPSAPQHQDRVQVRFERRYMVAATVPVVNDSNCLLVKGCRFVSDSSPPAPSNARLQTLLCCWLI